MKHRRLYQYLFIAAALYNIGWGLFTSLNSQWLFRFAEMPLMHHPEVFACLGMVVGLYGIIYAEVARRPEECFVLAAVGLIGKVLGPIGWLGQYQSGNWPFATIVMILMNDLIWWIPFALYLRDSWSYFRQQLTPFSLKG